ncbi:biotin/lipoyl-containing protein, partial [Nocardia uniformis]|uniref:acetyl-CoA carboxylase biotin carboxyl carrier protein subunit n=1 Tax=Nocardia uniformis TaxID=53432 RepID=UPI003FCDC92C
MGEPAPTVLRLNGGDRTAHVYLTGAPEQAQVWVEDGEKHTLTVEFDDQALILTLDGLRTRHRVAERDNQVWLADRTGVAQLREVAEADIRGVAAHVGDAEIVSPMPGSVIAVPAVNGAQVTAGTPIVVVEAMKMEHSLTAPIDGVVELLVRPGDQVKVDQPLARIVPASETVSEEPP